MLEDNDKGIFVFLVFFFYIERATNGSEIFHDEASLPNVRSAHDARPLPTT